MMTETETPITRAMAATAFEVDRESDTVLIKRYLNGDARAFETLFKRYQTPIYNLISRMVNGEDAHDLTQDVFCNALRGLPRFRGESKFSTWLYSIARNVCLNRLRTLSYTSEESLDELHESRAEFHDQSVDVQKSIEVKELQSTVNSVLATLPDDQRLLITLRDFEQLSYDEISEITGMSLPNVKSRLHRARIAFKNKFKPYFSLLREG